MLSRTRSLIRPINPRYMLDSIHRCHRSAQTNSAITVHTTPQRSIAAIDRNEPFNSTRILSHRLRCASVRLNSRAALCLCLSEAAGIAHYGKREASEYFNDCIAAKESARTSARWSTTQLRRTPGWNKYFSCFCSWMPILPPVGIVYQLLDPSRIKTTSSNIEIVAISYPDSCISAVLNLLGVRKLSVAALAYL